MLLGSWLALLAVLPLPVETGETELGVEDSSEKTGVPEPF